MVIKKQLKSTFTGRLNFLKTIRSPHPMLFLKLIVERHRHDMGGVVSDLGAQIDAGTRGGLDAAHERGYLVGPEIGDIEYFHEIAEFNMQRPLDMIAKGRLQLPEPLYDIRKIGRGGGRILRRR